MFGDQSLSRYFYLLVKSHTLSLQFGTWRIPLILGRSSRPFALFLKTIPRSKQMESLEVHALSSPNPHRSLNMPIPTLQKTHKNSMLYLTAQFESRRSNQTSR